MTSTSSRLSRAPLLALLLAGTAAAAVPDPRVSAVEQIYADWLDADYAVLTLAAGPLTAVAGRDAVAWQATLSERQSALAAGLARVHGLRLSPEDARARELMERALADVPTVPAASSAGQSAALCDRATEADADRSLLSRALYACFEHFGNHIAFEGGTIVRATALELLQELDSGERRRALFTALAPLWERINARSAADSPYRRLIRLSAAEARDKGASPVSEAARTVGATTAQVETWLLAVLEAWRAVNPGPPLEPWDYWHHYAGGVVPLDGLIPPERVLPLSLRYYRDLGADLDALGVLHDLAVRPGKAPLAYTDYVRIGRQTAHGWCPAIGRVSANVEHGGLFVLNEIVHEDGHAVHMAAVRTRPAFYGLGDDLFLEAFADVPSWSVAEPRWQNRYLGQSIDESTSLRALFGNVMLDVAWGLFELRMLREPGLGSERRMDGDHLALPQRCARIPTCRGGLCAFSSRTCRAT